MAQPCSLFSKDSFLLSRDFEGADGAAPVIGPLDESARGRSDEKSTVRAKCDGATTEIRNFLPVDNPSGSYVDQVRSSSAIDAHGDKSSIGAPRWNRYLTALDCECMEPRSTTHIPDLDAAKVRASVDASARPNEKRRRCRRRS